jgi:hypothetical protein
MGSITRSAPGFKTAPRLPRRPAHVPAAIAGDGTTSRPEADSATITRIARVLAAIVPAMAPIARMD